MENKLVTVIYDRRKLSIMKGMGYLEVRVNLGHKVRKYITLCYTSPDEWEKEAASDEAKLIIKKCEDILIAASRSYRIITCETWVMWAEKSREEQSASPNNRIKSFYTYIHVYKILIS